MEIKNKLGYRLYLRFSIIWGQKFTATHTQENFADMWAEDWESGLKGIDVMVIKDTIDYCRMNLEWPPSLAEFIKLCERSFDIPSPSECLDLAVNRDFSHTIVKIIFDKIGDWDMKHGKKIDLLKRFEKLHKESLEQLRMQKVNEKQIESNRDKIVSNATQGSASNDEPQISRSIPRGTGMLKAKDYLF